MPKEFYDWLKLCPLDYIKQSEDADGAVYRFHNWEPYWKQIKEKSNEQNT